MQILWLDLNSSYSHSSLALPAIHAQCQNLDQFNWDVVRTTININVGTIVNEVVLKKPDLICATAWLFTHEHLLAILSRVKVLLPDCTIALGGPEFLGENEQYLRQYPFIDMVFRGEGEEGLPQWLQISKDRKRWNEVTGVCFIDETDHYQDGGNAKVMNFAALNAPESSSFFCRDKAFVQFETARGCFNTCAFCVSGADKPVRSLTMQQVRERLHTYYEMGIKSIRLLDRTFNGQSKRAMEMLDLFVEFAGKLTFHLEVHPAMLSEEIREKLTSIPNGLLHLEAGIQSLRQDVLTKSRRLGSLEDSLDGLRFLCNLKNMETHADLIAGLPGYTYPMMIEDIHLLASYDASEVQLELLKLLPGTRMRREAAESGLLYAPFPPYEILQSDSMSAADLLKSRLLSRLLDMYYNSSAWQKPFRKLMLDRIDFLEQFMDYMNKKDLLLQPLSMERRGLLFYEYCKEYHPDHLFDISKAWIEAGLPLGKEPAKELHSIFSLPDHYIVCQGEITPETRFYQIRNYIYGFDRGVLRQRPVFCAFIPEEATN
ncbi:MAG: DUF4080 domain-containing protein [Bacteroidales bacterium]